MEQSRRHPALDVLDGLIGEWTIEATHPAFPSLVVSGQVAVEWLEGETFLIHRSRADHPDFPDSISIVGETDDGLCSNYFDSRGVHRVYQVEVGDGAWKLSRDDPGFSQRFTGTFSEDGNTLSGLWELSRDGSTWDDDLRITYRRVAQIWGAAASDFCSAPRLIVQDAPPLWVVGSFAAPASGGLRILSDNRDASPSSEGRR